MAIPDLRKLTHAVTLAETRSFIRASEQLHLTQSALTRSIQALEKDLGITLFDRSRQGVQPTRDGSIILNKARDLLLHGRTLESEVQLLRECTIGDTAMGLGPAMPPLFLPSLLTDFNRDYPGLSIEIFIESPVRLLEILRNDQIEFFVSSESHLPLKGSEIYAVQMLAQLDVRLFARADHPLASRNRVSFDDISCYAVATTQYDKRDHVELNSDRRFVQPRILCNDLPSMRHLLLHSDALMLGLDAMLIEDLAEGRVCSLPFEGLMSQPPTDIVMVMLAQRTPSRACEKISQWLRDFFKHRIDASVPLPVLT